MSENSDKFDIKIVKNNFESALLNEDDVRLQEYLDSFEELNKFFTLMGVIFRFVSKDLKDKMDLLKELLSHSEKNFTSTKEMIEYEKNNDLLKKKGYTSGSRTVLRLHRGLDFMKLFLKKLGDLKDDESTCASCKEAYEQTLAKHHPFIIRSGAYVAMYSLPTRGVLLAQVCGAPENVQEAIDLLPATLDSISAVFERIENLYTSYDLHKLP
ncbi:unnamed protein product [Phyllotreta striolata]|uniref:Glycolipid transfer protein domain-containing protein n=1 Tax=Phyllotreta striolata TaxID=444603 RepID=A0A9N9XJV9_PHYSR|nr:unnamed protein product [Phyllotreta striolata]